MPKTPKRLNYSQALRKFLGFHEPLSVREEPIDDLSYRTFQVRTSSIDLQARTIEAQITSDNPVMMPDYDRWEMIPEVLITEGAQIPASRQVPLLDSHKRSSTANQLGSVRGLEQRSGGTFGTLHFSSAAETEWTKVRELHVTDVSAGYRILEKTFVPKGTEQIVAGRKFTGPVNVVTKYAIREASITPIGADEATKMRGLDPAKFPSPHTSERFTMNPKLKALLVTRGMPETFTDDQAQAWMVENQARMFVPEAPPTNPPANPPADPSRTTPTAPVIDQAALDAAVTRALATAVPAAIAAGEQQRMAFRNEVTALCELADMPAEVAQRAIAEGDLVKARALIIKEKSERASHIGTMPRITVTSAGREAFRADAGTALTLRCLQNTGHKDEVILRALPLEKRGKGYEHFRYASLLDFARECLRMDGIDTRDMSRQQIAEVALGGPELAGMRGASYAAYHTTGSFPALTADAVNKSLMMGYGQFKSTWRGPMRQGQSAKDFKKIHRIRLGQVPQLSMWIDNKPPEEVSISDAQETYGVEAYSAKFGLSWRLLVNDDMDAISRVPAQFGDACSRTVNSFAWSQITSNPVMSDGVALFSAATGARKRTNIKTGVGAPSVNTIQTLGQQMAMMRGENTPEGSEGDAIQGYEPAYIVGPYALKTTIEQLVLSGIDPGAAISGVYNNTRNLVPVIEPLLDSNSLVAWYLFASTSQVDTVEIAFLEGQEVPYVREWIDPETLSQSYAVVQTFGGRPLNHRGIQKAIGA